MAEALPASGGAPALVITHDDKFLAPVAEALHSAFGGPPACLSHPYSDPPDEGLLSRAAAAGLIFCEFLGAAAAALSRQVATAPTGPRLIVRLHRFELDYPFAAALDLAGVERIVVVSDAMKAECRTRFGWPDDKIACIYNPSKIPMTDPPVDDAAIGRIGLLGYVPRLKRLDRALDLVERLNASNGPPVVLHLKGALPWQVGTLWNNAKERAYFTAQFARMAALPSGTVLREGPSDDLTDWFARLGWILSVSEVESFHMAAIEGMFAGATPLVIDRPGASEIFPARFIHGSVAAMAEAVQAATPAGRRAILQCARADDQVQRYRAERIVRAWRRLFLQTFQSRFSGANP